jgi:polyhydroxybutyrate depolymerase
MWRQLRRVCLTTLCGIGVVCCVRSVRAGSSGDAITRSIDVDGRERSYLVHVPPHIQDGRRPVVLAFHGGLNNAQSMINLTGLNDKADREGFIAVYPNGSGRLAKALTWNAGTCCGYAEQQQVNDVKFVSLMLDDLAQLYSVDPTRIYATGISNGGQMAYRLAADLPERIGAIAPVAGSLEVSAPRSARKVSVLHFHGTEDQYIPFAGGHGRRSLTGLTFNSVDNAMRTWAAIDECAGGPLVETLADSVNDSTTVSRRTYRNCREGSEVILYIVNGGGHAWPGHPVAERLLGRSTRDISATDVMWEFFRHHQQKP